MIHILVIDPHPISREGVCCILRQEAAIQVVGEACDLATAVALLNKKQPVHVIILNVEMNSLIDFDREGWQTLCYLSKRFSRVALLVFSLLEDSGRMGQIVTPGVAGFLHQSSTAAQLVEAVYALARGETWVGLKSQSTAPMDSNSVKSSVTAKLSRREQQVIYLIAHGLTNTEISQQLLISKRTVDAHRRRLLKKTESKNSAALIRYALQKKLIAS